MVDIKDIIVFEEWILRQPVETSQLIANRIAMRMLPFWKDFRATANGLKADGTLPFWRLGFVEWVYFSSDTQSKKLINAKDDAIGSYINSYNNTAYSHFLSRKGQSEKCEALSKFVHTLINNASSALSSDEPAERLWLEISIDASAIDAGRTFEYISRKPLWMKQTPAWLNAPWLRFKNQLLTPDLFSGAEHWRLWTSWYEDRLVGNKFDQELEIKKALLPDVVWEKSAKDANDALLRTNELHQEKLVENANQYSLFTLLGTKEIRSALADFKFDQLSSLMKMVPFIDDHLPSDGSDAIQKRKEILSEVSEALTDIVEDINAEQKNVPSSLVNAMKRYSTEASKEVSTIRPGRLWDLGATLRSATLSDDITYGLGDLIHENLDRAVDKHLDLMRDYFAATIARQRAVDDIELADDVTDQKALHALELAAQEIAKEDWGAVPAPDPEIPAVFSEQVEELKDLLGSVETSVDEKVRRNRMDKFWRKAKTAAMTFLRYTASIYKEIGLVSGSVLSLKELFPTTYSDIIEKLLALFKNIPWI